MNNRDQLLAALREARVGWTTVAQTTDALESTTGRLIDNASEHLSDTDGRDLKRLWQKHNKNLEHAFAALNQAIESLGVHK
jgi:hypothetical protein